MNECELQKYSEKSWKKDKRTEGGRERRRGGGEKRNEKIKREIETKK